MSYTLLIEPNELLHQRAEYVHEVDEKIKYIGTRMMNIVNSKGAVGLAGPQIGVSLRIIALNTPGGLHGVFINPEIMMTGIRLETGFNGEQVVEKDDEQCLSLPGKSFKVWRNKYINVMMQSINDIAPTSYNLQDMEARILQHEIDHLNGILISDKR